MLPADYRNNSANMMLYWRLTTLSETTLISSRELLLAPLFLCTTITVTQLTIDYNLFCNVI